MFTFSPSRVPRKEWGKYCYHNPIFSVGVDRDIIFNTPLPFVLVRGKHKLTRPISWGGRFREVYEIPEEEKGNPLLFFKGNLNLPLVEEKSSIPVDVPETALWREVICLRHIPLPEEVHSRVGLSREFITGTCNCRRCKLARSLGQLNELGVKFTSNSESAFAVHRSGSGGGQTVLIPAGGVSSGWLEFGSWVFHHQGPRRPGSPRCVDEIASGLVPGGSAVKIYIHRARRNYQGGENVHGYHEYLWMVFVVISYKEGVTAYVHTYAENSSFKEVFEKILS